nr:alpha/beta hydrolase [Streptomyces sp. S1D4-11]
MRFAPLTKAPSVTALIVEYRRAPEFPYPTQIEDMTSVYRELLARGYASRDITTIGDSAGGNLAMSTVLRLRQDDIPLPGGIITFSPWLDMKYSGETLVTNDAKNALVNTPFVKAMSEMFLGDAGRADDPLAGSDETLLDDARRLADRARAAGVDVTLSIVDHMRHVFPILAGRAEEADQELARISSR